MSEDAAKTPSSDIPPPLSPNLATLTPRVDALREKLVKDRIGSSARKARHLIPINLHWIRELPHDLNTFNYRRESLWIELTWRPLF